MKSVIIIVVLFVLGVAGAWLYVRSTGPATPTPQPVDPHAGHAHGPGESDLHGGAQDPQAKLCSKHRIPESVDAFCHPELVENLGFCAGHDVPEAFCTRCSPVLIAAFKVEGDWCDEHDLPETQCAICKGQAPSSGTS
jgi:hypothetical protein